MRRPGTTGILVGSVLLLALPALAASGFAYVQASSQLDVDVNPARYSPYNLLDRDAKTLWCEGKAHFGEGEEVRFYFKTPQTVDRLVITPAAPAGRVVETLRLSDGTGSIKIQLGQTPVEEVLTSPLHGSIYILSIEHVGDPAASSVFGPDVACVADVELYHGKQLVTPGKPRPAFDGLANRIVGSWSAEPLGAPDSTLTFSIDGTWTWAYRPLMGGKKKDLDGTYRVKSGHLQMRLGSEGRFVDMGTKVKHTGVDANDMGAPKTDYDVMNLNEGLGKDLAGRYNNAVF